MTADKVLDRDRVPDQDLVQDKAVQGKVRASVQDPDRAEDLGKASVQDPTRAEELGKASVQDPTRERDLRPAPHLEDRGDLVSEEIMDLTRHHLTDQQEQARDLAPVVVLWAEAVDWAQAQRLDLAPVQPPLAEVEARLVGAQARGL